MKQVHLLPESKKIPQDHQKEDLQLWSRFTYFLKAGKCHKTIINRTCNCKTGSLTPWEQENGTRSSARGPTNMTQVHLHTVSRKMRQDHQQEDLQPCSRFTYYLKAGKCHKTISKRTCSYQTRSLTSWEQENATRPSARGPAAITQVHILPERRKMPWDHQQENLETWNRFTYLLRAGKCHKTISKRTCNQETGSLTSWVQENATKPSARRPAAMKQVHLLPESRQMPQDYQQEDQLLWNRFTHCLRAGKCQKTISKRTCSYETSCTYFLRVEKCHKTISKSTCSHKTCSLTIWKHTNETRPSARALAAMKQVHLLSESRELPQDYHQEDLQL